MLAVLFAFSGLVGFVLLLKSLRRFPSTKGKRAKQIRPPVATVIASRADAPYEVADLHGPKVQGLVFKFLVRLAFTPFGRWLVMKPMASKSNANLMGGEYLPEDPAFEYVPPPKDKDTSVTNEEAITDAIASATPQTRTDRFRYNSIMDYYNGYKNKAYTPTDVAKTVLKKISESNANTPPLQAIIDWDDSVVMAMAEASTDRWSRGEPLSYLDGVPVAVKGELLLEPYPIMGGAKFKAASYENMIEGNLVSSLRRAGAVLIGVTNMQEFGTGTLGSNPNMGTPRNPHNPSHFCGGSSSGSGASIAAGLCPLALGADGGGSVRIPASLCGVAGLKPTATLLDSNGIPHIAYATVGVPGPLASSCMDIAIAMDVFLKGTSKLFSLCGLSEKLLTGLKVGVYSPYVQHADKEVVAGVNKALDVMKSIGAEVKPIVIPELEELRTAHFCLITSEMFSNLAVDVDKSFDQFNPETLLVLSIGKMYDSREYINSLKQRARGIRIMEAIFDEVDVVLSPSCAIPAPRINPGALSHGICDPTTSGKLMRHMFLANITGLPSLSVPVGLSSDGLPLGVQIMGRWFDEGRLIQVGHALETAMGPVLKKPQVYYNVLDQ